MTPDGRFLYTANLDGDSVSPFAVQPNGHPGIDRVPRHELRDGRFAQAHRRDAQRPLRLYRQRRHLEHDLPVCDQRGRLADPDPPGGKDPSSAKKKFKI